MESAVKSFTCPIIAAAETTANNVFKAPLRFIAFDDASSIELPASSTCPASESIPSAPSPRSPVESARSSTLSEALDALSDKSSALSAASEKADPIPLVSPAEKLSRPLTASSMAFPSASASLSTELKALPA